MNLQLQFLKSLCKFSQIKAKHGMKCQTQTEQPHVLLSVPITSFPKSVPHCQAAASPEAQLHYGAVTLEKRKKSSSGHPFFFFFLEKVGAFNH